MIAEVLASYLLPTKPEARGSHLATGWYDRISGKDSGEEGYARSIDQSDWFSTLPVSIPLCSIPGTTMTELIMR
jgi:hypothetical protein